jgi:gliding motility-associated-like protein
LEFVENKGQWDSKVRYKGEMTMGAYFVRDKGVTVLLHNPEDMARVGERIHGHGHNGHKHGNNDYKAAARLTSDTASILLRSHFYNVDFVGASPTIKTEGEKPLDTYNNYFIGTDPTKWASGCRIYGAVTLKDVYPNVDVRYYSYNGKIKYDILVHPGGDVSRIAMRYDGVDGIRIKNNQLVIKTSVGEIRELSPYSYQPDKAGRRTVDCRYKLRNNVVTFDIDKDAYARNSTLVIDPAIEFATFTGSAANNWGYTATYGPDGSFYAGGIVFSNGFPVAPTPGAFQGVFQGGVNDGAYGTSNGVDIGIMKFNPSGSNRVYATYLGGGGNEQPHSLIVDNAGNLVVAGRTNSSAYPLFPAGNTRGPGGAYDIILTKFNASGTALLGSVKVGGGGDDGVNIRIGRAGPSSLQQYYGDDARSEVILDANNNVLLASCTRSGNFPLLGPVQGSIGGGSQDGVILKFSPNLNNLLFSSYFGGGGDDAAYVLSINPLNGNIYVAGGTSSNNLPGPVTGSLFTGNQGGIDGFVTVLDPNGSSIIKTSYIGTGGTDQVYGIQFDARGFPYVMGTTTAAWPVVNAPYSETGGKQFIAKLQPDLSAWVYSTRFGTNSPVPNISPVAMLVDRCENVYVSGWGGVSGGVPSESSWNATTASTAGMGVSPNALQSSTDGRDFYFFVLEKNALRRLYATFFGQADNINSYGEHVDGGTSRFDRNGVIYQAICANCFGAANFPTQPLGGVWAASNGTGTSGCNLAALKISFDLAGVGSGVQSAIGAVVGDTIGCVPLTVTFRDTIANGVSFEWNFGDGSFPVTTPTPTVTHTFFNVGTYRVRLISVDPQSCNERDTSFVTILVRDDPVTPIDFRFRKLDPCDSFKYEFTNISVPPPGKVFTDSSFVWDFGDGSPKVKSGLNPVVHNFPAAGTYTVGLQLIDTNFCNVGDPPRTRVVRVAPLVKAKFETPPLGCVPYTAVFNNTSEGGTDFIWDFGDTNGSTDENPVHTYNNLGEYFVTLIAIDTNTCNKRDTSPPFKITVVDTPSAGFTYLPLAPQENTPHEFFNSSINAARYLWKFGDGDSLWTIRRDTIVKHQYNKTGTYNACLIAFSAAGCTDTLCRPVQALVVPLLGVPNAFTPLSGDNNSIARVFGFGIGKIYFAIYNRWGQKVFETTDRNRGWDGRLNGVVQAMDVYTYVLDVEFTDGTKTKKSGDITLLR